MASNPIVSWGDEKIEWSDDLLLRMEAEDDDHREMFTLMNQIFATVRLGAPITWRKNWSIC
jgi:hemerythrin